MHLVNLKGTTADLVLRIGGEDRLAMPVVVICRGARGERAGPPRHLRAKIVQRGIVPDR